MTRPLRICVVSGTRADFGLLQGLLHELKNNPGSELQLVATGMHLSPEHGLTYREIEAEGFVIDQKLEILLSADTGSGMAKSAGLAMISFADAYSALQPDRIVVLGDRFEILAAASTAMLMRIPLAHIHGGELSEGAVDDAIRHSISKMASLHFAATETYCQRLLQLGEPDDIVFNVGGLGVDAIKRTPLINRQQLESDLGLAFGKQNLLVTFHPATADEDGNPLVQCDALLAALDRFPEARVIITQPNADAGAREIAARMREYAQQHPGRVVVHTSLGFRRYLSCLAIVDAVVGNSSSGLLEVPTFKIGTVNIGSRQTGRLKAQNVIDTPADSTKIAEAIRIALSSQFREGLKNMQNPYGDGGASKKIAEILLSPQLRWLKQKSFRNLPVTAILGQP